METHDGPSGPSLILRPGADPAYFQSSLEAFEEISVWFVGLKVPVDVAERRERQRGDRAIGHARGHFDLVQRHGSYDIEVDTEAQSVCECAERIVSAMDGLGESSAFAGRRSQLSI